MKLTLKSIVAITLADVDIFLLKSADQSTENDKVSFTREEISERLNATASRMGAVLLNSNFDADAPLLNNDGKICYYSISDETAIDPNNWNGITESH